MTGVSAALLGACGVLAAACGGAAAQSDAARWPTKPIRAILPIAPGTGADVVFRLVFHELSNRLGQQIVIENRGGAGGTIGSAAVAKADPDGYTILAQSTSHAIAPALYPNMTYDVTRDFVAVVPFGKMPTALIISPSKGIKTVQQLVAEAKAKPGTLTFASAGVGSTTHLTMERFLLSAGITAIHVPFRGGGFRPEVSSGRVDFAFRRSRWRCRTCATAGCWRSRSAPGTAHRAFRMCRRRWRPATRTPTTRSGSACSCRRKRRAPSSTGCTTKA